MPEPGARPAPAPIPAAPAEVARGMDQARLQSAFDNYCTALATGNAALASTLKTALRRERAAALLAGERALLASKDDRSRGAVRMALESLR